MRIVRHILITFPSPWSLIVVVVSCLISDVLIVHGFTPYTYTSIQNHALRISNHSPRFDGTMNPIFFTQQRGRTDNNIITSSSSSHSTISTSSTALNLNIDPLTIGAILTLGAGGSALIYISGSEQRQQSAERLAQQEAYLERQAELEQKAKIEPKPTWTVDELKPYDGTDDNEEGPILFAADGLVFNVWKGRNFYGPYGEYHIFAGRDATRLLAKSLLEEESEEDRVKPLSVAEKAALQGWIYTFKGKYEVVGKLEGFDPKTTAF